MSGTIPTSRKPAYRHHPAKSLPVLRLEHVYRGRRAHRMERAGERYRGDRRLEVLGQRLRDAIGGAPSAD